MLACARDAGVCRTEVPVAAVAPWAAAPAKSLSASGGSEKPRPSCSVTLIVPGLSCGGGGDGALLVSDVVTVAS